VIGKDAPKRSLIDSVGYAASVINNSKLSSFLHIPCSVVYNGKVSAFVVSADDNMLSTLREQNMLYCSYQSAVSDSGVSSVWNSVAKVVPSSVDFADGFQIESIEPDNLIPLPTQFFVLHETNEQSLLSTLESTMDENSKETLKALIAKSEIRVVKSVEDILLAMKQ
jgi:hypothetical protein